MSANGPLLWWKNLCDDEGTRPILDRATVTLFTDDTLRDTHFTIQCSPALCVNAEPDVSLLPSHQLPYQCHRTKGLQGSSLLPLATAVVLLCVQPLHGYDEPPPASKEASFSSSSTAGIKSNDCTFHCSRIPAPCLQSWWEWTSNDTHRGFHRRCRRTGFRGSRCPTHCHRRLRG